MTTFEDFCDVLHDEIWRYGARSAYRNKQNIWVSRVDADFTDSLRVRESIDERHRQAKYVEANKEEVTQRNKATKKSRALAAGVKRFDVVSCTQGVGVLEGITDGLFTVHMNSGQQITTQSVMLYTTEGNQGSVDAVPVFTPDRTGTSTKPRPITKKKLREMNRKLRDAAFKAKYALVG